MDSDQWVLYKESPLSLEPSARNQVRTEHMFFASDERLKAVRQMIMAEDLPARKVEIPAPITRRVL